MLQEFLQTKIQRDEKTRFRVNSKVRKRKENKTKIALHAMILTGGARYWDRTEQNTKKSEEMRLEKWPDENEQGDETDAFSM